MAGFYLYGKGFKLADGTTVIESDGTVDGRDVSALPQLSAQQTWTAGQGSTLRTIASSAAALAIDVSTSNSFYHDLTEDTTLGAPSNVVAGMVWTLIVEANGTHELSYNAAYTFGTGTAPDFSAMSDGQWVALTFVAKTTSVIGVSYTETYG